MSTDEKSFFFDGMSKHFMSIPIKILEFLMPRFIYKRDKTTVKVQSFILLYSYTYIYL